MEMVLSSEEIDRFSNDAIARLVPILIKAFRSNELVRVGYVYTYIGDVTPPISKRYAEIAVVEEITENDRKVLEEVLKDVRTVRAAIYASYSDTPRPSTHHEIVLYLYPEPEVYTPNGERDFRTFAKELLRLVSKLSVVTDAAEAYYLFIRWCGEHLYRYTTRGNKAVIHDTGGDYPQWRITAVYYG